MTTSALLSPTGLHNHNNIIMHNKNYKSYRHACVIITYLNTIYVGIWGMPQASSWEEDHQKEVKWHSDE